MARNTSVVLDDHLEDFVDRQITDGRFGSAGDVIRAGLHLLEEHELKVQALRDALIEGEESGPAEPFDVDQFILEKRAAQRP